MEKSTSVSMDKHKTNLCVHIRKKYFGEDARPGTGMCMIVFAVPLLIPGIVITTVAFQDETGFSRFSALHVFGIVLLAADILLLLAGIALCVRFQSKVVPDDALQAVHTHKKIRKEVDLETITTMSPSEPSHRGTEFSAQCYPSIPPVNYFIDKEYNKTKPEHSVPATSAFSSIYQQDVEEHGYSKASFEDDSSSEESYDSDDCSSGSYIVNENMLGGRTAKGIGSEDDLTKVKNADFNFKNITTTTVGSGVISSNNFFRSSTTDIVPEIQEKDNNKLQNSSQNATLLETRNKNIQHEINSRLHDHEIVPVQTFTEVEPASDVHNTNCSPMSRRRLLAFSSESVVTSPKTPVDLNISSEPSQSVYTQHTLSLEENIADSRSSVFSAPTELKDMRTKHHDNVGKKDTSLWCSERNQNSSLINSPNAARPISFPSRDLLTRSTISSTVTKQSPSQKQPSRPQSTEGYISSTKTMAAMIPTDL